MNDAPDEADAELVELRARRLEELLARSRARPTVAPVAAEPIALTGRTFAPFLREHSRVVVDVWAPWCAPCRAMAPVLDQLARELAPGIRFTKVNADEDPILAQNLNVSGIPTLLLFERERLVDRIVGALPEPTLRSRIEAAFGLPGPRPSGPRSDDEG